MPLQPIYYHTELSISPLFAPKDRPHLTIQRFSDAPVQATKVILKTILRILVTGTLLALWVAGAAGAAYLVLINL